jgi:RHS repeat-associated protein
MSRQSFAPFAIRGAKDRDPFLGDVDGRGNYTATYVYNAAGELTSYQDNNNSSLTYSYDANGELTGASGTLNGSNYSVSYSYDLNGNRTMAGYQTGTDNELLSDDTYKYTYDNAGNANPYLDFNGSGQLTERYLTNPNALSQFYGQVNASGNVQWFLTDNIHSIRQVVSANGTVLDAITYDPYGNILSQTNSANAPRFLYAGGAYDTLTGYDQFGRRYYSPADGRWTSQDPLGFRAGDTDLYRYVFNASTYRIDPSGLQPPPTAYQLMIATGYYNSVIMQAIYGEMCGHPMDWAAVQAAANQAFNGALAVAPADPLAALQQVPTSGQIGGMVGRGIAGGLAGAGGGTIAIMIGLGNIWNPVGWSILGAVGTCAIGGAIVGMCFGRKDASDQPTFQGGLVSGYYDPWVWIFSSIAGYSLGSMQYPPPGPPLHRFP